METVKRALPLPEDRRAGAVPFFYRRPQDVVHLDMPMGWDNLHEGEKMNEKKRIYRISNHCTPRSSSAQHHVLCKCPANDCGKIHIVPMRSKPIVMPRILCREHVHQRYNDGEG